MLAWGETDGEAKAAPVTPHNMVTAAKLLNTYFFALVFYARYARTVVVVIVHLFLPYTYFISAV